MVIDVTEVVIPVLENCGRSTNIQIDITDVFRHCQTLRQMWRFPFISQVSIVNWVCS